MSKILLENGKNILLESGAHMLIESMRVLVNGVDKSSLIIRGSFKKTDSLYSAADILKFDIDVHLGQTFEPDVNDTIDVYDGFGDKQFSGVVMQVEKDIDQALKIVSLHMTCKDNGQGLSRVLIIERIEDSTVNDIITYLLEKYAPEFDDLYVDCPISVVSITFNNITIAQALDKLSKLTNYHWYMDYDNHLHFFEKSTELAPFNITDGDGNYIPDTLTITKDLTQIKNRITVRGGEVEVNPVTFTIKGSKGKRQTNGNVTFDLSYKFSHKPVIKVNTVTKVVGVVGYDNDTDFDAMWSFEQKYINFTNTVILDADDVEITGTPLETIQVRVQDSASIAEFGRWDAVFSVPGIKTRDEALQYAEAQREASKDPQYSGSFSTYESGLRSGQVININSTKLGIDEDFFIQRVSFVMVSSTVGYWSVEIATFRQVSLTDVLGKIVGNTEIEELSTEALLSYIEFTDDVVTLVESSPVLTSGSGPYQTWPTVGTGTGAPAKANFSTISS